MEKILRINSYSALRITDKESHKDFVIETLGLNYFNMYIRKPSNVISFDNIWNNTVWPAGKFEKRINKPVFSNCLVPYSEDKRTINCWTKHAELMLTKEYVFQKNTIGILLKLTADVDYVNFMCQMLKEPDFEAMDEEIAFDGNIWSKSYPLYIPTTATTPYVTPDEKSDKLYIETKEVTDDDIAISGKIYNYFITERRCGRRFKLPIFD